jgi:hypothetical protein
LKGLDPEALDGRKSSAKISSYRKRKERGESICHVAFSDRMAGFNMLYPVSLLPAQVEKKQVKN